MKRYSRIIAALVASGALCAASDAIAADCNFTSPSTVYVTGSSAAKPYLATLSQTLLAQATPVTLVYVGTESCQGVTAFTTSTALTSPATFWTPNPDGGAGIVANTCNFSVTSTPATSVQVDGSISDVFASTCIGVTVPATQQEFGGPIQAMTFVVNPGSTESSISEDAAHVVFKDIGTTADQITPWTDPNQLFIRQGGVNGSGTRGMIGTALGFVDSDWSSAIPAANVFTSSGTLLPAVANDTANANQTLSTLSAEIAKANRPGSASATQVKVLALQAKGQSCGYFPDSTDTAYDMINVREGRYHIWGPIHFITAVSGDGGTSVPVSTSNPGNPSADAALQAFVNLVQLVPGPTVLTDNQKMQVITAAAGAGVVAQCAMRVRRDTEVGPEQSFLPTESCGCYWESVATGATPASCTTCSSSTDCASLTATPTCRYGFCEAN